MYKLCIFDLDGTLLNTLTALTYATNLTLHTFGLGDITIEDTKRMVGDGYKTQMKRALSHFGQENMKYYDQSLTEYMKNFSANCMRGVEPYDGIPHLLLFLKEHGIKAAVFSNKPHNQAVENIETIFNHPADFFFRRTVKSCAAIACSGKRVGAFDLILGQKEEIPKKPSPEGALVICRKLQVKPEECLYLGDTNTDMETGIAAGMDTVGVTWGFRDREELAAFHPRYLADHPSQVEEILSHE